MYYVYLLTDPRNDNEVFYCGKGKGNRWKSHLGHWSGNGKNNPTANKIKQIQKRGLQPGVIFLHKDIVDENEAYRLEELYIQENFDKLTNLKILARPPSPLGRTGWNKGLTYKCPAISKALTGRKRGPYSEEHKKKISDSLSGEKHPMYGKRALKATPIIEEVTGIEFPGQTEAANHFGIKQSDINNCLRGRQKTVKGYKFRYL